MLTGIGVAVVSLIAFIAVFSYTFAKDKFNYADENATDLASSNGTWHSEAWSSDIKLEIDQASTVFYWHDADSIRWKCDGDGPEKKSDSSLSIRHSHCLIYLPKQAVSINALQSQIVLVRPQASLALTAKQGSIKIAENGEQYKYLFETTRTKVNDLTSYDNAEYTLKINTKESSVGAYKY